jgi:hypothetical protein
MNCVSYRATVGRIGDGTGVLTFDTVENVDVIDSWGLPELPLRRTSVQAPLPKLPKLKIRCKIWYEDGVRYVWD